MMSTKIISAFISIVLIIHLATPTFAFETDQYNLPPEPLADIGDEVTQYVAGQMRLAAAIVNDRIKAADRCLAEKLKGCEAPDKEGKKLEYLRSEQALAKAVYDQLSGGNLMTTKFGKWIHGHKFQAQPSSYKAPYFESIYLIRPSNYVTLSPTIRMYGHEFGVDKLEHLFQQGHQYYEKVEDGINEGRTREEAVRIAVEWGKRTERTYYGILTSGVYSNADLNANYVGLRFYEGLSRQIKVGDSTRPAMFALRKGLWHMADADAVRQHALKPFIGAHLSEAYNPSAFRATLVGPVKRAVKRNSCVEWKRQFPALSAHKLAEETRALELWHGEDYGHTKRSGFVHIGEICFSGRP